MEKNKNKQSIAEGLISYILPKGMSDWFEIVNYYEEPNPDTSFLDTLYDKVLHVHLDERLSPDAEKLGLKPNGFTETKVVKDYPLRNRKVLLHCAGGATLTRTIVTLYCRIIKLLRMVPRCLLSTAFFFKTVMDNHPITASTLGSLFGIKGSEVERCYKHHLSDYETWDQKDHAEDWILMPENIGENLSIDETQLCNEVYTILSNKAGKGRKGTIVAVIKGTKVPVVASVFNMIPAEDRAKVKEITMDFSDSMYKVSKLCFPNAYITIDCFHIIQRLNEGLEEMRLKIKREAVTRIKKERAAFAKEEERKARRRAWYRRTHKRNPKETRGRKRIRRKKYRPAELPNGDTIVELLTRSRNLLSQSGDKWGESKKTRSGLIFKLFPKLKEAYSLVCMIRCIFKKHISVEQAKEELHQWYDKVSQCTFREIKSARDCIKAKETEVLNYFNNRSTNASAESLNSKLKGFRALLRGIVDVPFFMYRISKIYG